MLIANRLDVLGRNMPTYLRAALPVRGRTQTGTHRQRVGSCAQRTLRLLIKWLAMAALLPLNAVLAEPANNAPGWTINPTLPIHQKPKLHPEFSDPVLGDQAQIVEWAWSPQYAERFGLQPQADGLPNGGLWLVGVKIERKQYRDWQRYTCNIVGVMDNKLPIIRPLGEIYTITPGYIWSGGLPGINRMNQAPGVSMEINFTPAQTAWHKNPKNKRDKMRPERGLGALLLHYYHQLGDGLAYFEANGECAFFRDPQLFRNELRFPTKIGGEKDEAVFESSAITFDIPDSLMKRIYPHVKEADDWTSCLTRRIGGKSHLLNAYQHKDKRFATACEPITDALINR